MLPLTPDEGVTEATESGAFEAPRAERWGNHPPVNIRLSIPFFIHPHRIPTVVSFHATSRHVRFWL